MNNFVNPVSSTDLYEPLKVFYSDTEIEIGKSSGDLNDVDLSRKPLKPETCPSKAFTALKIKDEMKIDLCKKVPSLLSNIRSLNQIQTIDEVIEKSSDSSRATSSHKVELQENIESIKLAQKTTLRPISRKPNVCLGDKVKLLLMPKFQSHSSVENSEYEDWPTKKVTKKDSSTVYDPPKLTISKATQFEAGDFPELRNFREPPKNFIRKHPNDSCQNLISMSSLQSSKSKSCFNCVWKPIERFCHQKQEWFTVIIYLICSDK